MKGTALITGATRGVGKAIATELSADGCAVLLNARSEDELQLLAEQLPNNSFICAADLAEADDVEKLVENATAYGVNILVNNLGIYIPDEILDDELLLRKHMDVNVYPAIELSRRLFGNWNGMEHAYVFNICSVVCTHPRKDAASYTISKYMLKGFNDVFRESGRLKNIHVTAIYPGSINTSSWDGIEAPTEQFIQPEDIGKLVGTCLKLNPSTLVSEIHLSPLDPKL